MIAGIMSQVIFPVILAVFQKRYYSKYYGFKFLIYFYNPVYKAKLLMAQICKATSI